MTDKPLDRRHLALGDVEREIKVTRRMLQRVPEEHFDWRPHSKSMSLGELASHIADLFWWQVATLSMDGIDMAHPWPKTQAKTHTDLMASFEAKVAELQAVIAETTEAILASPWTLSYGGNPVFTLPKADVQRIYGVSHLAHHRGQLTVYLRMHDVPLPPSYGPTADENPTDL